MSITGPDVLDWLRGQIKNDQDKVDAYNSLVFAVGAALTIFPAEARVTLLAQLPTAVLMACFVTLEDDDDDEPAKPDPKFRVVK